jgi:hypothetical protein
VAVRFDICVAVEIVRHEAEIWRSFIEGKNSRSLRARGHEKDSILMLKIL